MWAAYEGPSGHNATHAHVAVQVVIACDRNELVAIDAARRVTGRALIVRPLTPHALEARGQRVWSIYLEAASPLGRALRGSAEAADVRPLPRALVQLLDRADSPPAWIERVEASLGLGKPALDRRLQQALRELLREPGAIQIGQAAESAGLSAPRLRALAKAQLGVPLATWLLWQKLERAGRAMAAGAGVAEAAILGGFADQSHLVRTMRRMFGVTPGAAAAALR
jgi:AraC-like DNA-binding protein